jgi:hypothetical protein
LSGTRIREEAVVDGQTISFYLLHRDHDLGLEFFDRTPFWDFMLKFNKLMVGVRNGKLRLYRSPGKGFPRELVWFYGVERLRSVEKDENDWRNLPLLLWD